MNRLADIAGELDRRDVGVTWLVRPRTAAQPVTEWVKERARRGDGVLMHGYDHMVMPSHRPVWLGRKAEFAALPAHEAGLRLTAAVAALERVDLRVDGFAPPRWLGSPGTLTALRRHGFTMCADAVGVHDLRTGDVRRARVYGLNRGTTRSAALRCYAMVQSVARAARRTPMIRLTMDAGDLAHAAVRAALLEAVDLALDAGARASTYGSPALVHS